MKLKKLLFLPILLTSCSPGYVIRAAYEEGRILWNRENIDDVIKADAVNETDKEKLKFVRDARLFAATIGLIPGDSFTQFTKIDRDVLSWVVMASKKDAFEMYTWWFPVVGSVPYKGYFEREDADLSAKDLEDAGYETWVRGTDAFSTLGWFNDPILSSTLKKSIPELVETVIHESVHSTIWFQGSVPFNESLAQFIAVHGAYQFFKEKLAACDHAQCKEQFEKYVAYAEETISRSIEFSTQLNLLYTELEKLYTSSISSEEKIMKRDDVFQSAMTPLRTKFPNLKNFDTLNNAKIMQSRIYYMNYQYFREKYSDSLTAFIESFKKLRDTDDKAPW